jgi:hypothetical protein
MPPNKAMQLTKPGQIGASQLIASVRQTSWSGSSGLNRQPTSTCPRWHDMVGLLEGKGWSQERSYAR